MVREPGTDPMKQPATDAGVRGQRATVASRDASLARGLWALVGVTWLLIGFGALVRAKKAGLACPDWPLCFGAVVPDIRLTGVIYEFGHRALAGGVALGFVALFMLARRRADLYPQVRGPFWAAAGLLLAQIVMGGLTVLIVEKGHGGDPRPAAWTVTSHLLLGNAFAAAIAVAAWRLQTLDTARKLALEFGARSRRLLTVWTVLLLAQFVLGGIVAGNLAGMVCVDFPSCSGGVWFPGFDGLLGVQLAHRTTAYALALVGLWMARSLLDSTGIGWLGRLLGVTVLAQILAGALNIWWHLPPAVTVAHSALASALFLMTAILWQTRIGSPRSP